MSEGQTEFTGLEIAITGMAGRFPGAKNIAELWNNLQGGVESVTEFTDEELFASGVEPSLLEDPKFVRRGAVIDGIELFDAGFFGITPREAELMDPQHRLFLQTAWHALESAGCDPSRFDGAVGVYGAASSNTYLTENVLQNERVEKKSLPALFGNQGDYLTTRVSYKLNLRGPSLDVQTSCSSSLVALHLACQALLAGECDLALAGGVSITVPNRRGYVHQEQGIYSPDGHCRAFSSRAEGTVGGNGVAIVALRRLEDAQRDGDRIHAIVRGSAINNDGSDKVGYSAPSVDGQTQVVRNALAMADVEARSISYVETHGTGTALGDPIEIAALSDAFATPDKGFCAIGSIKTNIGHLDTAAGVTGIIKATLALAHKQLPPSLNCDEPDPKIDFPNTPFFVNRELRAWEPNGPRRAGVSSFGIGGTNAHVILEEAPAREVPATPGNDRDGRAHVALLSAKTGGALDRASEALAEHVSARPELALADIAHSLQTERARFSTRRAVVARDTTELARALTERDPAHVVTATLDDAERSVAFLFPGQGSQYAGMGRDLYERDAVYREHVDRAAAIVEAQLGRDLRPLLHPTAGDEAAESAANAELKRTALTQPALFIIEYALAQRWIALGVTPAALIGHSIGEYVAATLAGVFDLEAALALVCERGRLMQSLPSGSMLAVPLPASEVEPLCPEGVSIAAVNELASCVASGPDDSIATLHATLARRDVEGRELVTSHAFHSPMMDPILAEFEELVRAAAPRAPRVPFVSNTTGTWIRDEEATDPAYWSRHLRQAVRFADGIKTLIAEPRTLIEVGPGTTLTTLAKRTARKQDATPAFVSSMRHPREAGADDLVFARALGQAWLADVAIDWQAFQQNAGQRVELPGYAFDERRFWIEPTPAGATQRPAGKLPDVADWFWSPSWSRRPVARTADAVRTKHALLWVDRDELGTSLAQAFEARGARVTRVRPGASFRALEGDTFEVRPGERADAEALCAGLDAWPDTIVHAWGLDAADSGDDELDRGLLTLLALGQACATRDGLAATRTVVLTRNVQAVTGDEAIVPERAASLGAATALTQEVGPLDVRTIDLDEAAHLGEATLNRAHALCVDIETTDESSAIAYRGRHRWVRTFEPFRVEREASDAGLVPAPLRDGGHYLVIGGLGSIGLEVAGVLARDARAKLVLTTRGEFPARDDWNNELAARADDDETARRIRELLELEEAGASVLIRRADVTDAASLRAAIAAGVERFGPLVGVVHAAGAEKRMVLFGDTTRSDCAEQLAPKLQGLRTLEEVLAETELDFCVVQSSLSSVLGVLAMVGYVAAHHVVDAFCARHNQTAATPWTSANWDHWLTWREPEFAHGDGDDALFMSRDEGAEAFRRLLGLPGGTQVVVSSGDLERRIEAWFAPTESEEGASEGYERPELSSDFVAPETPAEKALAQAWSDVLGIARIGVHDSFFELGGDSVLGLQAVAKLAQKGYRITPAQIFEHPTIAGLAQAATTAEADAEQALVSGEVPLLPIQRWFFELGLADPSHFNMPTVLAVPADVERATVVAALSDVTHQHDALRLRFERLNGASADVVQSHADEVAPVEVTEVDLSALTADERAQVMRTTCDALHQGFDLTNGPVQAAALFRCGADEPAQLVWIAHHLVVDAVSWRILAEDFETALAARRRGAAPELPAKTSSYGAWARALKEDAGSNRTTAELELYAHEGESMPLPRDGSGGDDRFSSAAALRTEWSAETTNTFLTEVPKAYGTRADEVLLCALTRTLAGWTQQQALWVDLEGHGRDGLGDRLDVSRTVGWFTTIYPVRIDLEGAQEPGAALKRVKETLRAVPRQGLGYGALRYHGAESGHGTKLAQQPRPEVNFLYLGRTDAAAQGEGPRLMQDAAGSPCAPDAPRPHALVVVAHVENGRLHARWDYSSALHDRATIQRLATEFEREVESLIRHCTAKDEAELTPSDFPAAQVKQGDLDKLLAKIGKPNLGARKDGEA